MVLEKDWMFSSNEYVCGLRAAGVLIRDGRILVQKDRNGNEYALPGGHIRIGETLEDGLAREFREETGAEIAIKRLVWSEESLWSWKGRQAHTIVFYYLVEECEGSEACAWNSTVPHKDNQNVVLEWMRVEDIEKATIYPRFLKDEIGDLDKAVRHFVSRE